jgi:predicted Fe-Mo cluster-binding NifX family protein
MRIAISNDNGIVGKHFGRCEKYSLYEIKERKIIKKEMLENPGHEPFFLPKFLKEKNVNVVIAQGAGPRAIDLFEELGIEIKLVNEMECEKAIELFLEGNLSKSKNICNH